MNLLILMTLAVIIIICRYMLSVSNKKLTPEQKVRLSSAKMSSWHYLIYFAVIMGGIAFIEIGGLPFAVASVVFIIVFVCTGIWLRFTYYRQFKSLKLPRSYIKSVTAYNAMTYAATISIIIVLLLPENNNGVFYTCPNIADVQSQLQFMTSGESKLWSDTQGLVWTISIPNDVSSPPTVSHFSEAKWTLNSGALVCRYASLGGKSAISAFASFNSDKPTQTPWRQESNMELNCQGDINQCKFSVISG